jgi:hypothetical protein
MGTASFAGFTASGQFGGYTGTAAMGGQGVSSNIPLLISYPNALPAGVTLPPGTVVTAQSMGIIYTDSQTSVWVLPQGATKWILFNTADSGTQGAP